MNKITFCQLGNPRDERGLCQWFQQKSQDWLSRADLSHMTRTQAVTVTGGAGAAAVVLTKGLAWPRASHPQRSCVISSKRAMQADKGRGEGRVFHQDGRARQGDSSDHGVCTSPSCSPAEHTRGKRQGREFIATGKLRTRLI